MRFPVWLFSGLGLFALSAAIGAAVAPQAGPALVVLAQIGVASALALAVWTLGRRWPWAAAWGLALAAAWVIPALTFAFDWGRNTRGGLMAWLLPWAVAVTWQVWAQRGTWPRGRVLAGLVGGGLAGAVIMLFLLTSGSRGAVVALMIACGAVALIQLWGRWRGTLAVAGAIASRLPSIVLVGLLVANLVLIYAAGPFSASINALDVGGADMGRLSIWRETWYLIGEAPWTGFGLASYEGVFSHYARLIQVPLYTYAHQLYLGVFSQQGVLGVVALLILFAGALRIRATEFERPTVRRSDGPTGGARSPALTDRTVGPSDRRDPGRSVARSLGTPGLRSLETASLISTLTLALHGLVDDSVYGNGGLPLLFLWAGMAAAVQHDGRRQTVDGQGVLGRPPTSVVRGVVGLLVGLVVLLAGPNLIASAWVNAATVRLARAELAEWPSLQPAPEAVQAAARADLDQALEIDPGDRAGRFRRGLLLIEHGDYGGAVADLQQAFAAAPDSRATRKAYGLALAWSGAVEPAVGVLAPLPEAGAEMQTYSFFWESVGQLTLSEYARSVAERLP